ncbi:hypothetical protein AGR1C_Cc10929 [Agrobacterium fabacearum TT111]|nr:hypothetical protein AGR1C_Cc10929 [Agrobacterium fabacearum TT111]
MKPERFATDSPINDSARRLRHLNCFDDCVRKRYGTSRENGAEYECVSLRYRVLYNCLQETRGRIASRISSLHYPAVYRRGPAFRETR